MECTIKSSIECYLDYQKSNDIIRIIEITVNTSRENGQYVDANEYLIDCKSYDNVNTWHREWGDIDLKKFDFDLSKIKDSSRYKRWRSGKGSTFLETDIQSLCQSSEIRNNSEIEIAYKNITDWYKNGGDREEFRKERAKQEAVEISQMGKYRIFLICNDPELTNELMLRYRLFRHGEIVFDYYARGLRQLSGQCRQVNQPLSDKELIANSYEISRDKYGDRYFLSSKEKSGPKIIGLIKDK